MAFLDFAQSLPGYDHPVRLAPRLVAPRVASFSSQEWQIVTLARTDGLRSLRGPGRLTRLRKWIFGEETSLVLANGRLEALRRIAVEAWHRGYAVSLGAIDAFHTAGFSTDQLELLITTISNGRNAPQRRS